MKKFIAPMLVLAASLPMCQGAGSNTSNGVTVRFDKIENDLAFFDIKNISSQDVFELQLEISYFDESGNTIKIDTVSYGNAPTAAGDVTAFLTAGSETFVVQSIESGTTRASARRIE